MCSGGGEGFPADRAGLRDRVAVVRRHSRSPPCAACPVWTGGSGFDRRDRRCRRRWRGAGAGRRRLAQALHENPDLLTSGRPEGPPQVERLIRALQAAGARRLVQPRCGHCHHNPDHSHNAKARSGSARRATPVAEEQPNPAPAAASDDRSPARPERDPLCGSCTHRSGRTRLATGQRSHPCVDCGWSPRRCRAGLPVLRPDGRLVSPT
jgi:hypothetical protein